MCWKCAHPNATRRDYLEHILDLVVLHGWAVEGVRRDGLHPPWAYTVGLTAVGLPELVVMGMSVTRATPLLNVVASRAIHADPAIKAGDRVRLSASLTISIVEPASTTTHLLTAIDIYGSGIRVLQVVRAADRLSALRPSRNQSLTTWLSLEPTRYVQ